MPIAADVRFGSKTDLTPETFDDRSYLNSKHALRQSNVMERRRLLYTQNRTSTDGPDVSVKCQQPT
jgi:hypothetical protein